MRVFLFICDRYSVIFLFTYPSESLNWNETRILSLSISQWTLRLTSLSHPLYLFLSVSFSLLYTFSFSHSLFMIPWISVVFFHVWRESFWRHYCHLTTIDGTWVSWQRLESRVKCIPMQASFQIYLCVYVIFHVYNICMCVYACLSVCT